MAPRIIREYYRQARFSRGTAAQWEEENPVLYFGEPGFEVDTRGLKVGDGETRWVDLQYVIGPAGDQGPQGDVGPQGMMGLPGEPEEPFLVVGPRGETGVTGATGATGAPGPQGPAPSLVVEDGEDAPIIITPGPVGAAGATGSQGPAGPQGAPAFGYDGEDGDWGPFGVPGPTGGTGATGATGPQGPAVGLVAEDGEDAPFTPGPQGQRGERGEIGATGPAGTLPSSGMLMPIDGEDAIDLPIPGNDGPAGATGQQGAPGNAGPPGMEGPDGPPGEWIPVPGPIGPTGATGADGADGNAAVPYGRPKNGATTYYSLPGVVPVSNPEETAHNIWDAATLVVDTDIYMPIYVATDIEVDQMAFNVTTAQAGADVRIAIFEADGDWQPGALVAESGAIAATSSGVKTYDFGGTPITLTAGRYLLAINVDTASVAVRRMEGYIPGVVAIATDLGGTTGANQNVIQRSWRVARSFAAYPDPGTAWDTVTEDGFGFFYIVFLRISDPIP